MENGNHCEKNIVGKDNVISMGNISGEGSLKISVMGNHNEILIGDITIAENLIICLEDNGSKIKIGSGCTFESTVISVADDHNYVVIGEDCMFARDVCLMASDFHSIIDRKSGRRCNTKLGITIGNHVWLGYRSMVLKGCRIADHVVLAAGSTAVHDIEESYTVAGGNPAGIIKRDSEWERRRIPIVENEINILALEEDIPDSEEQVSNLECFSQEKMFRLSGWSYIKKRESGESKLFVEIDIKDGDRRYYTPYREERADVAQYFQDQRYLHSGFYLYIPIGEEGIDRESIIKIRIIIENEKERTANTVWVMEEKG